MTKPKKSYTKLIDIYNNTAVFAQLENLLESQQKEEDILRFLKAKNYPISRGTLSNLKSKRKQARELGVPVGELLNPNTKTSLKDVGVDNISKPIGNPSHVGEVDYSNPAHSPYDTPVNFDTGAVSAVANSNFWTADNVLEEIIKKGYNAIQQADFVDTPVMLKALDLYLKFYGDDRKGLSMDGLRQYAIYTESKMIALQEVLLEYVPADKQEEASQALDDKQSELLNNLELKQGGREFVSALQKAGLEL